jgi:hypothetical protein
MTAMEPRPCVGRPCSSDRIRRIPNRRPAKLSYRFRLKAADGPFHNAAAQLLSSAGAVGSPLERMVRRLHSITRSARSRSDVGIAMPICFAVFMLITNSNFVGRSTGSSAGLAPLRIFAT